MDKNEIVHNWYEQHRKETRKTGFTEPIEILEWLAEKQIKNCIIPDVSNNEMAVCDHKETYFNTLTGFNHCKKCGHFPCKAN